MRFIDLRSDTITKPTPAMRSAMAEAEVGDDVFGEDPTVRRLESLAAERMGKEAALFVSSGTMGNLVCLLTHCGRGDEIILGDQSHTFFYEQGGSAALGGIQPRTLKNGPDGKMDPDEIREAIRPDDVHFPRTRLIALENTHNRCNGSPLDVEYMRRVGAIAEEHCLKLHVDGARIFNAAVALGVEPRALVEPADSVTFCLSKGLAAPVGSVVCGDRDFIRQARRNRKILGGGMRQAGILAAAGIVAMTEMVDRLAEDHANARKLAQGVNSIEGLKAHPDLVKTNIVFIDVTREGTPAARVADGLRKRGVGALPTGARRLRAVTNYQVTSEDMDRVLDCLRDTMNAEGRAAGG